MELGVALLATVVKHSAGQRAKIEDYLPKREEETKNVDMHAVLAMFKAKAAETNAMMKRRHSARPKRRFKRG